MAKIEKTIKITPASCLLCNQVPQFVQRAMSFKSVVYLNHDEYVMNAKSLLGMMLLKVSVDDTIKLSAEGEDAEAAFSALEKLL